MNIIVLIVQNIQFLITKFWYYLYKRNKNIWVFGEWGGNRCCDNCMYFANYLAESHPEIMLFWITKPDTNISRLDKKVKVLAMDSAESAKVLKKAGAVFFAHTLNDITYKHVLYYSGALVINFWHGMPWKKIELDMPLGQLEKAYVRYRMKVYEASIYLSTSKPFTEVIKTAFECKSERIIQAGYPRNSFFYSKDRTNDARNSLLSYLASKGMSINEQSRIIVYMPTFRDKSQKVFSFDSIMDNDRLISVLADYNAVILQKTHFVTSRRSKQSEIGLGRFFQITDFPSQELLAAADILITDYSSCFFDYLVLDRPIIHYLYDYEYYADKDRGLYYTKEEAACGIVSVDIRHLIESITIYLEDCEKDHDLRVKQLCKYMGFESPHACSDIYHEIRKRQR